MSESTRTPSLTPSRSPTPAPEPPIQPDHFYGSDANRFPLSPDSDGRTWLDPEDDPFAMRGIPVFKPTMDEFQDFEAFMNKVECWGMQSGIVKVIPPKEWTDALPPMTDQLANVKLKNPIEQHMIGQGGLFRQQNVEKRRVMSVREWAELCSKDELRAPGVDDVGLYHGRSSPTKSRSRRGGRKAAGADKAETAEPEGEEEAAGDGAATGVKTEQEQDGELGTGSLASPPHSAGADATPVAENDEDQHDATNGADEVDVATNVPPEEDKENSTVAERRKARRAQARELKEATLAMRNAQDATFIENFDPASDWLPSNTTPFDFTPEFCQTLERQYWRNCGFGKPAWYGADMAGSLFTDETKAWNVANLPSLLTRLLPADKRLPGVNTPYLYFGMWRATFAWHVEDMDLFSINYIHFGAPKFWYAIPQERALGLEHAMRAYFPKDTSKCPQFLRHKSFLASPKLLSQSSCKPNTLVQHAGEFVITFPRGYHAGFNLGFNCAESVNFALDSWMELARKAKACECISDSVRIDIDALMRERDEEEERAGNKPPRKRSLQQLKSPNKRKTEGEDGPPKAKKAKTKPSSSSTSQDKEKKGKAKAKAPKVKSGAGASGSQSSPTSATKVTVMLKLGPKPKEPVGFPCCLCVSMEEHGLLRVHDPPAPAVCGVENAAGKTWRAHEECANVVPETWVDEVEVGELRPDGSREKERVVFGVDGIVKDRWNLKCSACNKTKHRAHGAPIQCVKGKCPKAFHVSCAKEGAASGVVYQIVREVEKEVILLGPPVEEKKAEQTVGSASGSGGPSGSGHGEGIMLNGHGSQDQAQQQPPSMGNSEVTAINEQPSRPSPSHQVLKVIRKVEVQVLCHQHNPAVTEAKKVAKLDKIKQDLLTLPPSSRIKIRVSAGVFEVSLVKVNEHMNTVEVIWDRGLKREFKWGSVVFGSVEGQTVGQKPSEMAPEEEKPNARSRRQSSPVSQHIYTFESGIPPIRPAPPSHSASPAPASSSASYAPTPTPYSVAAGRYPYHSASWQYPSYQAAGPPPGNYYTSPQYAYPYTPYPYYSGYGMPSHHVGKGQEGGETKPQTLQWKQPYLGPNAQSQSQSQSRGYVASGMVVPYPGAAGQQQPPQYSQQIQAPQQSQQSQQSQRPIQEQSSPETQQKGEEAHMGSLVPGPALPGLNTANAPAPTATSAASASTAPTPVITVTPAASGSSAS